METPIPSLLAAFKRFQLIYVALRIGLVSAVGERPVTPAELAVSLDIPELRLQRLLRGLVWAEVLETVDTDKYRLTNQARVLMDQSPTSLAGGILFQGRFFYGAWGHLLDYVRDGVVPFEKANGASVFDLIGTDPSLAEEFNAPMAVRTAEYAVAVAQLSVFRDAKLIVDVAAGEGRLLTEVLLANPAAHGLILDLPSVRSQAEKLIVTTGLAGRCRFHSGDMFLAMPPGGDVYVLKWVLHDWDDAQAVRILRNVRAVIVEDARVIIVERLLPENVVGAHPLIQADLNMLMLNGGAERTRTQYESLLNQADLTLLETISVEANYGFHALIASASR